MRNGLGMCCVLVLMWVGTSVRLHAAEPRREAVHRWTQDAQAELEPAWKQEMRKQLQMKVTFEYVNKPLSEAIQFLLAVTKCNIILDPEAAADDTPINLKVQNMSLEMALKWILKLAKLDFILKDRVVFISTPDRLIEEVTLKIYDVRGLTTPITDFPAPSVDLLGRIATGKAGKMGPPPVGAAAFKVRNEIEAADLAERIQTRVRPETWAPELGTSIEERNGMLVVVQPLEVQQEIARFLNDFRAANTLQVRIEVKFLDVAQSLLDQLGRLQKDGDRWTIFLRQVQLDRLTQALDGGDEAKRAAAAKITCRNTQRSYVLSGQTFRGTGKDEIHFRGTILEVRPTVSFDRKYVTLEWRLTRVEGGKEEGALVRVLRSRATVTCLDGDTVLLADASVPGEEPTRRIVALLTPSILHLEPREIVKRAEFQIEKKAGIKKLIRRTRVITKKLGDKKEPEGRAAEEDEAVF